MKLKYSYIVLSGFSLFFLLVFSSRSNGQELGGNYNENIEAIDNNIVSHSGVEWVRGFVNVPRYFLNVDSKGNVTGVNEEGISDFDKIDNFLGVQEVSVNNGSVKAILSLKLQFKHNWEFQNSTGVPAENTPAMHFWMSAIKQFLLEKNLGAHVDILVLGNEPMWETENEDAEKFAVFQDKLIDLVYDLRSTRQDWNYDIYVGALNKVRNLGDSNPIAQKVLKAAKENDKVQGLDLHPHVEHIKDIEEDLQYIREIRGIEKKTAMHRSFPCLAVERTLGRFLR